jgi:hypothetical protein
MESDQPIAAASDQPAAKRKPGGRPFQPGVSGNPSGVAKHPASARIAELIDQWTADFDGRLTAIERSLLQQAARLLVKAERTKNPDIAVRASSAASRMLASVRIKKRDRRGRPPIRERVMEAAGE